MATRLAVRRPSLNPSSQPPESTFSCSIPFEIHSEEWLLASAGRASARPPTSVEHIPRTCRRLDSRLHYSQSVG